MVASMPLLGWSAAPREQAPLQAWLARLCAAIIEILQEDEGLYRKLRSPGASSAAARHAALERVAPARRALLEGLAAAVRAGALEGLPATLGGQLLGMAMAAAWSGMEPEQAARGSISAHTPSAGDNVVSAGAL